MAKLRNYLTAGLTALALSLNSCSFKPIFTTTMTSFTPASSSQLVTNTVTLEQARKNPNLRQTYLDKTISKTHSNYEVLYDLNGKRAKSDTLAVTYRILNKGRLVESVIYVGEIAFEDDFLIKSDEDIKYLIEAHEFRHATQNLSGIGKFSSEQIDNAIKNSKLELSLLLDAKELDALHHGLKLVSQGKHKINPVYLLHQKCNYSVAFNNLIKSIDGQSEFQKEFIFNILGNVNDIAPEDNYLLALFFPF